MERGAEEGEQGVIKYEILEYQLTHPDVCPTFVALLELALA
jgi:hypothetical protein